uniref:FIST C-domain domain-containing protein n=1 Tax=Strigamia maritima TaxID=126957 RepID=T1J290_STRMM
MADINLIQQQHFVLSVPLIADRILSFLPAKDLYRAAQVCQSWAEIAKKIKRKRKESSCIFWKQDAEMPDEMIITSLTSYVKTHLNEVSTEPALSLNFVTTSADSTVNCIFDGCYPTVLPIQCKTAIISCDGVIGMQGNQCVEVEAEDLVAVSSFFLPKLPGVEMKFWVKKDDDSFKKFISSLTKDQPIKALVLLSTDFGIQTPATKGIDQIMTEQNNHLAVAGAFAEDILLPECSTLAITFAGERVKAASVVINSYVKKIDRLHCPLKRLKNYGLPEDRSFAFMFACVSRGVKHWKEKNVEIKEFRKMFPNTPLYGFYGQGEIGSNTSSEANESTCGSHQENTCHQFCHSYSTVILLVSIC